jgi:hypothetical protein
MGSAARFPSNDCRWSRILGELTTVFRKNRWSRLWPTPSSSKSSIFQNAAVQERLTDIWSQRGISLTRIGAIVRSTCRTVVYNHQPVQQVFVWSVRLARETHGNKMLKIGITNIEQKLELLAAAQSQMVTRLAYAIAIGRDAVLQQYFARLASGDQGQPFLVSQLKRQAWLRVDRDGTSLHREPPLGLSSIDLDEALETKPLLAQALDVAISATNAVEAAVDLLRPVFEPFPMMSRSEFQAVYGWAPLLEHLAYHSAMRALHVIDALRPTVRHDLGKERDPNSEALETYWKLIHSIGQLTLLASHSEARAWLSEMASGFVWETWTPTLILTRERTSWLGAVAAKAAIAFGETAVESYLRKLAQTEHPMMAFDALFGLSAIALANPRSTGSILNEILAGKEAHLARAKAYAGYLSGVYKSAARVLSGPILLKKAAVATQRDQ